MLKRILIILSAVIMIFAVSCKENPDEPIVPPKDEVTDNTDLSDDKNDADSSYDNDDEDPDNPFNAENLVEFIKQKYNTAKEAYFWFAVSGMPPAEGEVDFNNLKEIDGLYYYKVGHDTIKNVSDLKAYLKTIFSDGIISALYALYDERFIDVDGELWAADMARGTNITVGNAIFSVTDQSENRIVYTANVEELDYETGEVVGMKEYDYVYEKTDSGWRWTEFTIYE